MNRKPRNYWTRETVLKEASKYKFRSEWRKNKLAYYAAYRLGIQKECYAHMNTTFNPYVEGGHVYCFEFNDNSCYVGLTINLPQRFSRHFEDGAVFKKINDGRSFKFKVLETNVKYPFALQEREEFWANFYEAQGWSLLNSKGHLGKLGGTIKKWDKEAVRESSLKYSSIKEWFKYEKSAYRAAIKYGILDECISHMKVLKCGSDHKLAKLTEENVKIIKTLRSSGEKLKFISEKFNVSESTILDIIKGRTWKHLN